MTLQVLLFQTGVFRANCIDCLDRTNVVQTMVRGRGYQAGVGFFEGVCVIWASVYFVAVPSVLGVLDLPFNVVVAYTCSWRAVLSRPCCGGSICWRPSRRWTAMHRWSLPSARPGPTTPTRAASSTRVRRLCGRCHTGVHSHVNASLSLSASALFASFFLLSVRADTHHLRLRGTEDRLHAAGPPHAAGAAAGTNIADAGD